MQLQHLVLSSALSLALFGVSACVGSVAGAPCEDTSDESAGMGGAATGGGIGGGGATTGAGGTNGGAGGVSDGGSGATGGSSAGTGGTGTGSMDPAGPGTAGMEMGGMRTDAGGDLSGTSPASSEDDGADCTVAGLPDSDALTANPKLPDPFKKLDGTRITARAEWRCRRQEIRKLAEKFAYGTKPPKPQTVTGTVSKSSISVMVTDNGKTTSFSASIVLPKSGSAPYPAIIVYGGGGFGAPLDGSVIDSEGIALINFDPYSNGKEGTGRANKQGAFYDIVGKSSTTGLLVAWSWGVSRIIDVIAQSDGTILKADAVGVTGCSRFGKGAFVAGVFDQRIALTMPIESGTAGAPIWRGVPKEGAQSLSSAYGEQPWFGDAFSAFTSDPTKAPLDTHEAIAMIAPRGLFIMDNPHIANLGPRSAHAAALAGAEVYEALGAGDSITYHSEVQNGSHCAMRPEWATPLRNNIQRFLKKTGTAPGVIRASSSASAKTSDWIDWTTPTLNP